MAPTTGPSPPRYRVVKIAGRPIIATPDQSLRLRLAGLAQYRPVTKKRACLRAALRLCAITGIDRLFTQSEATPVVQSDGFDFEQMLDEIRGALGAPSSLATIIWPQLIERRRLYAHLMSTSGTPVAFCKIALNADNADRLKNELDTIQELGKRSLIAARLPRILHHLATGDRRCVIYEPFPLDIAPLKDRWEKLALALAEIAGEARRLDPVEVEGTLWWQRFVRGRGRHNREFLRQVDEVVARPITVNRVQGDATPSNIFRSSDSILICDWEYSSPCGPRKTDEISYYLAANHYQCLLRPSAMLSACLSRFAPDRDPDAIGELAIALAFLCGRNDPRALALASHWRLLSSAPAPQRPRDAAIAGTSAPYRLS